MISRPNYFFFKSHFIFIVNECNSFLLYIMVSELILASWINKNRNKTLWLLCFYGDAELSRETIVH